MAIPENSKEDEVKEDWLATYADAITLLMAFFVMLLTFSKFDIPAFEEAAAAISGKISSKPRVSATTEMMIDVQDMVYNMQADEVVKVEKDKKGVVIELASSAFYKPGSATIRAEAVPVLKEIADMLAAPKYATYNVEVEGHTDDDPISTKLFPSNWELSSRRATRVVRFFIQDGMEPLRLKAVGMAETRPKLPNRDANGVPIPENQAENRRVLIRVFPMSLEERAALYKKTGKMEIVDTAKQPPTDATGQTSPTDQKPVQNAPGQTPGQQSTPSQ